jgi:iron complex outermembrane recepter protein
LGAESENYLGIKANPAHQATLRSMFAPGRNLDLDLWPRYVGTSSYPLSSGLARLPAYTALDARIANRPLAGVELSPVGKNLLQRHHQESVSDLNLTRHEVERTFYGKASWAF